MSFTQTWWIVEFSYLCFMTNIYFLNHLSNSILSAAQYTVLLYIVHCCNSILLSCNTWPWVSSGPGKWKPVPGFTSLTCHWTLVATYATASYPFDSTSSSFLVHITPSSLCFLHIYSFLSVSLLIVFQSKHPNLIISLLNNCFSLLKEKEKD